ncbi:tetratricopeptide repeat protein [Fulvivirga ulvae]|uniref:tetratricopeptide repeat protein n=1 Tax=Fulvivirga ulvae TaxID=2904245 RepID=UPI001F46C17B|nr:tetratricopeptide repeat protein [Fulvivirga ulvae]UII34562.1 tetratricopeptide repeat protein [Fulvivirga ulvae]
MSDTCVKHIEDFWKNKTKSSTELFNKGSFEEALEGYQEALYRAEVLNHNFSNCLRVGIPFIQVYVISCNNLANTYEEMGQLEEAEKMLKRVIYYLLHMAGNDTLNIEEIQSELKRASLCYVRFADENHFGKVEHGQLLDELKEKFCKIS